MGRFLFVLPQVGAGDTVRVDTASGSDTPASIVPAGGGPAITGAVLHADASGGLPRVLGPSDGTSTLYVKTLNYRGAVVGSPVTVTGADLDAGPAAVESLPTPTTGDAGKVPTVNEAEDGYELDTPASGGSVAGAMTAAAFLFTEVADAGVYEATLDLAAGSLVRDVQVFMLEAPWAADTAALDVIDPRSAAGNGYADAADLLSTSDTSISADLTQPFSAEDDWSNGYSDLRGLNGNWHGLGLVGNDAGTGVYYGTAETVTVRVTTTNAAPVTPTAVMLVRVLYQPPVTADVPVFTPAV